MENPIYIFYSLISEDKSDGSQLLKLHGPFIHSRPDNSTVSYIFEEKDFKSERRFLSKFLREKYSNRISIFHYLPVSSSSINLRCTKCDNLITLDNLHQSTWACLSCGSMNEFENYDDLYLKSRQSSMMEAQEYFDKKFEQMEENYNICNRTRKRK